MLQNYKKILSCIPEYILEAARGRKQATFGPRNITESLRIASLRMEIDGTTTTYQTPRTGEGKIAEWLTKYGWKPDTPLQEGGLIYPIWPRQKKPPKAWKKGLRRGNSSNHEIQFVKGPSLEEEMGQEREQSREMNDIEVYQ